MCTSIGPVNIFPKFWHWIYIDESGSVSGFQSQRASLPVPYSALQWRNNEHDSVSNHQPHDCLLNRLFRRRSKKTSKLRVTGLCEGNSPVTDDFPTQRVSNAENVSIWWRHHVQRFIIGLATALSLTRESPYLGKTVFILKRGPAVDKTTHIDARELT